MQHTRYWCAESKTAGIKTNTYTRDFGYVTGLVAIAKTAVPSLQDGDIKVVTYLGDRWKGMCGIEFPCQQCPEDFESVARLEPAYS